MQYGLRVRDNKVFCYDIEISDTAIARATGVDRRLIATTVKTISSEPGLQEIFSKLTPICHLKDMAPSMGWGVIEIEPDNASKPGILAGVAGIIAKRGISIRQATVDDPEMTDEPRLFIITESMIPVRLIPEIKKVEGVKRIIIY